MAQYSSYRKRNKEYEQNYYDPRLPNYRPEWWRCSVDHWLETLDWCGNLKDENFKDEYLLKVPGELPQNRVARIKATSPEPFFKDSVKDNKSIFVQFELADDAPALITEYKDNVDLQGNDINQWAARPLVGLFRDGGALMGIQPPQQDERSPDRRPSLTWVPMRDIFWPRYNLIDGQKVLTRISIRRGVQGTDSKGLAIQLNDYWVYELDESGRCMVTVWHQDKEKKFTKDLPKEIKNASAEPLKQLPFTDKLTWLGDLELTEEEQLYSPLSDILNLNQEHYNTWSEYKAVARKTALPTPYRTWGNGVPTTPPPFYAGPGRCIDLPAGSEVGFVELQGQSLPELRALISEIELKIAKRDNKLFGMIGGRSATEAEIENTKAKVGLPGVKRLIESAFQDLFQKWELFSSQDPEPVGGIIVSEQALKQPPDPSSVMARVQTVERVGVPPTAAISAWLREGYYTSEDFEAGNANIPVVPLNESEVIQ